MAKSVLKNYKEATIWLIAISFVFRVIITLLTNEGGDPAWHLNIARFVGQNLKIPLFEFLGREAFSKAPLFHILGGIFYNIFGIFGEGAAEIGIKMISPFAGTGILIFTYLIAKELTDERTAFFSALFMAFIPINIYLSATGHTEMIASFFFAGAVYYMLKDKIYLCGVFSGLALLSKEFTIMLIPLAIFYFITKDKKSSLKKSLIVIAIAAIISAPWYIRNYILLGNPVWPLFNQIIGAKYVYIAGLKPDMTSTFANFLNLSIYESFYLALFGVPEGFVNRVFEYFPLPKPFLLIWLLGTIIFLVPFIKSFSKENKPKKNGFLMAWILAYVFVLLIWVYMNNAISMRYFVYALPALAIFWGLGMKKIELKYGKAALILILLISAGFVFSEAIKAKIGNDAWNFYKDDFKWVQENTPKDSIFMAGSQAMSYKLNRQAIYITEDIRMTPSFIPEWYEFDYIFVNQEFKLDKEVVLDEDLLKEIRDSKDLEIVYKNNNTKTEIYRKV